MAAAASHGIACCLFSSGKHPLCHNISTCSQPTPSVDSRLALPYHSHDEKRGVAKDYFALLVPEPFISHLNLTTFLLTTTTTHTRTFTQTRAHPCPKLGLRRFSLTVALQATVVKEAMPERLKRGPHTTRTQRERRCTYQHVHTQFSACRAWQSDCSFT